MKTVLHVMAGTRGDLSYSRRAGQAAVQRLLARHPVLNVIERDLGGSPVAHPDVRFVQASLMQEARRDRAQREALALSETLIDELDAADFVLLSTPMHTFMVPSVLKARLDCIVRPRRTFRVTATGKVGLLRDRPVRVLLACGGALGGEPVGQIDFVTPYLCYVFKTIGIMNLQVVASENLNRGAATQTATKTRWDAWLEGLSS